MLPLFGRLKALFNCTQFGNNIDLPELGSAAGVYMLNLLPARLRELYSVKTYPRELNQEVVIKAGKCLPVREGEYAQLIQKRHAWQIVELVIKKSKEINRLFSVPKDEGKKTTTDLGCAAGEFSRYWSGVLRKSLFLDVCKAQKSRKKRLIRQEAGQRQLLPPFTLIRISTLVFVITPIYTVKDI